MTRRELADDIQRMTGKAWLSQKDIRVYSGLNKDKVREAFHSVPHMGNAKGQRYHALDIADTLNALYEKPKRTRGFCSGRYAV